MGSYVIKSGISFNITKGIQSLTESNIYVPNFGGQINQIKALAARKNLIDNNAAIDYFDFPLKNNRYAIDNAILANFKCRFYFNAGSITSSYYEFQKKLFNEALNQYPKNTTHPHFYYIDQTPQICLYQSSKATYLTTTATAPLKEVSVRGKFWVFYNFLTSKMYIVSNIPTQNNAYKELSNSQLDFIDLLGLLHPSEAQRGFYENDNELTYHGYFSTRAFLYLIKSSDPLSANPVLSTHGFEYQPGYNMHAYWGSDSRRSGWNNYGGAALVYRYNRDHKRTHFFPSQFSTYPFLTDGIYTMNFPLLNKSPYNFCIFSSPTSQDLFLNQKYNLIACIQDLLKQKLLIPSDAKILTPEQSIFGEVCLGYNANPGNGWGTRSNSPGICGKFFEFDISNTLSTNNLYASSSNNAIQLPKPKLDENLKPIRRYIKITKLSHETLSGLVSKKIGVQKITEIIPQNFSYPFSAMVGTKIDSRAFAQIPTRTFECKLKKVLVPSNYFIQDILGNDVRYLEGNGKYLIYNGDWDGSFKLAWTNNPAWILMDILTNKRYGLGNYIESEQIDIWELYKISRWCDGVDDRGFYYGVPDSYGGIEPRHAFNALIQEKFNIFDMINQIASVFRGNVYYMNSLITFDDDRLKPVIGEFNNSDVKDGLFNYTNLRKDEEYTAVDVAYMDEKDNYKPKIEYVEDSESISKKGILKKEINAFGITSRGQARRFGLNFLYKSAKENLNVSFVTDIKALLYKPGDLITIHDELLSNNKNYGVVKQIKDINSTSFEIIIDKVLDPSVYDDREITLFTPTAKPKYDDISISCQRVPSIIEIPQTNNPLRLRTISSTRSIFIQKTILPFAPRRTNYNQTDIEIYQCAPVYDGRVRLLDTSTTLFEDRDAYLVYIKDIDINNVPSKYGHWCLCLPTINYRGFAEGNIKCSYGLRLDTIDNANIKYQTSHYFFENINCYCAVYADETYANFTINNSVPLTTLASSPFQIIKFEEPAISYIDLLESDKPSIETFYIKSYTTGEFKCYNEPYNQYTCLTLSKGTLDTNYANNNVRSHIQSFDFQHYDANNNPISSTHISRIAGSVKDLYITGGFTFKQTYPIQDYDPSYPVQCSACYAIVSNPSPICITLSNPINNTVPNTKENNDQNRTSSYLIINRGTGIPYSAYLLSTIIQQKHKLSDRFFDGTVLGTVVEPELPLIYEPLGATLNNKYSGVNISVVTPFQSSDLNINESKIKPYMRDYGVQGLVWGSNYSLKFLNKNSKTFKIQSINENYVNEYNITASEFNPLRFKEIEENNYIDDLNSTFNASFLHNSSSQAISAEELKSPNITSLTRSGSRVIISWQGVVNATNYRIFVKTPSKITNNYITEIDAIPSNVYTYEYATLNYEVGTYTFYIEAFSKATFSSMYKISQPAIRSIIVF